MAFNRADIERVAAELSVIVKWGEPIHPGDLYLAQYNTGPHLLICKEANTESGFIVPTTCPQDYAYDTCDCVKVIEG